MAIKQWVNLPKKDIFKDKYIDSVDRCGELSIDIKLDKPDKSISYKAKITPVGSDNVTYNTNELDRNRKFHLVKGVTGIVDKQTVRVKGIRLPPAGGNKYKIEVEDGAGNVVSGSVEVETKRKLYYQNISMETGSETVPSYSLSFLEQDSMQHHIELMKKGKEVKIPYMKTIMMQSNGNNLNVFGTAVAKAFNIHSDLKDFGVAVVYSNYLADKGNRTFQGIVMLGANGGAFKAKLTRTHLIIEGDRFLWHGLDDDEDLNKEYFIDGAIKYTDTNDSTNDLTYIIDRSDVDIHGTARFPHGGYFQVEIIIQPGSTLETMASKANGLIEAEVDVRIADGWTNGFSWTYSGAKLITCARKVQWEDMPTNTRDYTWVHEIGHRFGMVAYGDKNYPKPTSFKRKKTLPDAPSTLYGENRGVNDQNHSGPHCAKGAIFDSISNTWSGAPGCVMFGANGIGSNHAPKSYCDECKPIVRKLDLSE